ncbi:MAG: hypothetical protein ACK5MP_00765 [Nostocoides sp.]
MGWEGLFDDLEAQFESLQRLELEAEVADRTRRELAGIDLISRLLGHRDSGLTLRLVTGTTLSGVLADIGADWIALAEPSQRYPAGGTTVIALSAVTGFVGLGRRSQTAPSPRRFALGYVLRALGRDRQVVIVTDTSGSVLTGTVHRVGADHVDLAEHPAETGPRTEAIRAIRAIPFWALVSIAPAR